MSPIRKTEICKAVDVFAEDMKTRLCATANMEKKGWRTCNLLFLLAKLRGHVRALDEAAQLGREWTVEEEAVHIANYAMMIRDSKQMAEQGIENILFAAGETQCVPS